MIKRIVLLIAVLLPASVFSATTGELVPTAVQGGTNWTNWLVDTLDTSDDERATYENTAQDWGGAKTFGVDITSSSIDSIIVHIEGHGTGGGPADQQIEVQLLIAGTGTGDIITVQLAKNSDSDNRVVGSTDALWNTSASESDVENAGFGVQIRDANGTADIFRIDYVRVEVIYTAAGGGKVVQAAGVTIIQ